MRNLTPWFPDYSQPRRIGYYDTCRPNLFGHGSVARRTAVGGVVRDRCSIIELRLFWNGRAWVASRSSQNETLFCQRREWRGQFSHAKR